MTGVSKVGTVSAYTTETTQELHIMNTPIRTYYSLSVPEDAEDAYCSQFVGYFDSVAEAEAKAAELGVDQFEVEEVYDYEGDGEYTVIG